MAHKKAKKSRKKTQNVSHKSSKRRGIRATAREVPVEPTAIAPPGRFIPPWDPDEIRLMSTDAILEKLASFGITISAAAFVAQAETHDRADRLFTTWEDRFDCTAEGRDEDFPWMAALVLWERLLPGSPCLEMISDRIVGGEEALDEEAQVSPRTCQLWLEAWEMLKTRLTPSMTRIADVDELFLEFDIVFTELFQDLESGLRELAPEDPSFHERRVQFCREIAAQFPDEDPAILAGFVSAEAESLWKLGRQVEADRKFQELIDRFPDRILSYVTWADCYLLSHEPPSAQDLDKAEAINLLALDNESLSQEWATVLYWHLAEICERRGEAEQAEQYTRMAEEGLTEGWRQALEQLGTPADLRRSEPAPPGAPLFEARAPSIQQTIRSAIKLGRNDPCWCGSGKKYKKCHLSADQERARATNW